ncbi:BtpA family [Pristimantis euphronides]
MKFLQLFRRPRSIVIGMVHLKALPGTPRSTLPVAQILEEACKDAEIYRKAGIDGLVVENMNDIPYTLHVGPEVTASMATVCTAVRQTCPGLPLGVQVLACANQQALAVALASGLDFIRAESFVFSQVADEGLVSACAGDLLRYRKAIGAEHIQIFADIKKKHSSHAVTADVSISETAKAAEFFLADGVVLTGVATGQEADPRELKEVQRSVQIPVLIGSGVTLDNVEKYINANALIIGSYFKHGGDWRNSLDYDKVAAFMDKINKLRE